MGEALKEFFVSLGLDADASSFASAQSMVDLLEKGLQKLVEWAMKAAQAFTDAVLGTAAYGSQLDDASKKTGLTTQQLQEFAYVSQLAGGSAEAFQSGVTHLARKMNEVKNGSKEATQAFAALGVRVFDNHGKMRSIEDVLNDVSDGLAKTAPGAERMGAAFGVMGKGGADAIPMLGEGSAKLKQLREDFKAVVGTLSSEQVSMLDKFDDSMVTLRAFGASVVREFAIPIIEALQPIVDVTLEWIKANRQLISSTVTRWGQNLVAIVKGGVKAVEGLVIAVKLATVAFVSFRLAMLAMAAGTAIANVGLGQLAVNFMMNSIAAGIYGARMVGAAIKTAAAWTLAALPLIAITAAIALMILALDDFFTFLDHGDSLIGHILNNYWAQIEAFLQKVRTAIHEFLGPVGGLAFELGLAKWNDFSLGVGDFVTGGSASHEGWAGTIGASSTSQINNSRHHERTSMPIQINIHPPPGTSPEQIALEVWKQAKEQLDADYQRAVSNKE